MHHDMPSLSSCLRVPFGLTMQMIMQEKVYSSPPVVVLNTDGVITHVSGAIPTLFGYDGPADFIGRQGRELWACPEKALQAKEDFRNKGYWRGPFLAKNRKGHAFPVYGNVWSAQTTSNTPLTVMLVSQTEQTLEMLTLLDQPGVIALPEILIRGALHDLNNVICIASGGLHLLRSTISHAPTKHQETFAMVQESCARATRLLGEMGKWLVSWTGKAPEFSDVAVGPLVTQAARLATIGSNVEVVPLLPSDLWKVRCDEPGIFRVLTNLALNARHAMKNGGLLTITADNVSTSNEGSFVRISISDTGPGMNEDVLAHVFDLGFTTKLEGSGVGLAVAKHIVAQNGGRIEVESSPGRGTTFRVLLPASGGTPPQE